MKRTLRSLLSMVMALSMLLSMVLISGLTASAATKVYLTGEEAFAPGSVTNGYTITPDAEGNGFTVQSGSGLDPASGYAGMLSAKNTSGLKYFVLVADSYTGNWAIDNVAPGWQSNVGTYVFEANGTNVEGVLWMYPGLSNTLHVTEMYFSDTDPTAVSGDIFVPLSSLAPGAGMNNAVITATGADGLGVSLAGSADVYTYWNITMQQIKQTPYLVVDLADDCLASFWPSQYCSVTYGWAGAQLHSLRYAGRQVVDLSKLATDNNLCLTFRSTAAMNFDALYLTNVPEVTKYHVKFLSPAAGAANITPTNSGDYGLTYTVPENAAGDQYCYYSSLPQARYLVYKLKEGSPSSTMLIAANTWWTGAVYLPAPSTTRTVVDLHALPCYSASNTMLLQNLFTATTEFEEFYFVDEETANVNYLQFETNGGTAIPAGCVVAGAPFSATVKEGYAFGGWYTDAALTQAFDINNVYEGATTLYAKWVLAGDVSPVFGQLQTGTTAESASAAIRFAAAIDSRDFAEAGFVFSKVTANPTVDDAASLAVSTTTVWTSINAAGSVVTAEELHGSYIFACTVNGIGNANFGTELYVRAYVKDFDGNYTYTDAKTYSVTDMLG